MSSDELALAEQQHDGDMEEGRVGGQDAPAEWKRKVDQLITVVNRGQEDQMTQLQHSLMPYAQELEVEH